MSVIQTAWDRMTKAQRITAVNVDISNNKDFAQLSGVVFTGKAIVDSETETAATDGEDVKYGEAFVEAQNRKQLRYVVLHENTHKALRHCTQYQHIVDQYPELSNTAMDYVVNMTLEEIDPTFNFIERPVKCSILVDPKYAGMSFIEILRDLLKDPPPTGAGGAMDVHEFKPRTEEEEQKLDQAIEDAVMQGSILAAKLQGAGSKGSPLDKLFQKRDTNWKRHMRDWITQYVEGDDYSRFNPPNRRFLPLGIVMPTHFSESTGELIIAGDTSASMWHLYPVLFGEICNIVQSIRPDSVRTLWWDGKVCGDQKFMPDKFDDIANQISPAGGGGTNPECVTRYIQAKKYKPKAVVWLTDGIFNPKFDANVGVPQLWGVVDNDRFVPPMGKVVRIYSK